MKFSWKKRRVLIVISLHFYKTNIQASHVKISNNKHQITNKLQIPMTKTVDMFVSEILSLFGILNFGHCDLFGI